MPSITFEEVEVFIKEMAVFHAQAVEKRDHEYFKSETFRKIIEFAADEKDMEFELFAIVLLNAPEDCSEPDFNDLSHLMELMEKFERKYLLSEKAYELYLLYKKEFWGSKY